MIMKKIVKSLVVLAAFLIGHSTYAFIDGFSPYVGGDALWWSSVVKRVDKLGGNRPAKNYWGGNIFLGGRFCEDWGLEIGYSWTGKKSKSETFNGYAAGLLPDAHAQASFKNRFQQYYLDLNGYLPLDECWELMGSIGIGSVKSKLQFQIDRSYDGRAINYKIPLRSHKTKAVLRLGVGAQFMATECFGIRGMVRWATTSFVRAHTNFNYPPNGDNFEFQPFRSSIITSLGVFWRF